jgi:hypothetical protein
MLQDFDDFTTIFFRQSPHRPTADANLGAMVQQNVGNYKQVWAAAVGYKSVPFDLIDRHSRGASSFLRRQESKNETV